MSLRQQFADTIRADLQKQFGMKSSMEVPRLEKVVLNMGVGTAITEKKELDNALENLSLISGQKAVITKAKKSVASFKVRTDWAIGCKVTLRGARMWSFVDRLVNIAIPRIRDFRGLNARSFDGRGNYNIGISEQIIFPEIDYDRIDKLRGLDIAIITSAQDDAQAYALLRALQFPFRNN